jgi:hypothetical protein
LRAVVDVAGDREGGIEGNVCYLMEGRYWWNQRQKLVRIIGIVGLRQMEP